MKLTILGASGHGRVVADIAELNGYDEIEFLDDNEQLQKCGQFLVVGKGKEAEHIDNDFFVAIGDVKYRRRYFETFENKSIPVLIHPDAVIAKDVIIGPGTVVMAGAVINPGTRIGKGCIINTSSSIDHDCIINDFVHVAVGAHLCGTVQVDHNAWIGAGAIVSNNIHICESCFIGAGSVVIRDLTETGIYVGVPARLIKRKRSKRK